MEPTKIYGKLLTFQGKVETIKKDGANSFFKKANGKASTYATLPNILAEVKPILNELKLVVTQPIINGEVITMITDSESGESVKSGVMLPLNLNAQQTGSAITYFRRYTLSSLLSLEIDEDDDGNKASQPTQVKKEPVQQTVMLTTEQFEKSLLGNKKQILSVLKIFNGQNGKAMTAEQNDKLVKQLKDAPEENVAESTETKS